jgi:hypothetical protein
MPRYDIHFQALTVEEQTNTFKFVGFTYNPTIGVTGFQMLINQWLKCLLTPQGSDPTDLNYGTGFTGMIGSNLPLADARDVCSMAIESCNEQVFAFQSTDSTLTSAERLATATITQFIPQPSAPGFDLYVELKNQANQTLTISVPAAALGV